MAKYCTKESKILIGEKLQRIVEHLETKGHSTVIVKHLLFPSTQPESTMSVSRGQVPMHSECQGSEGQWKPSASGK